ncbi:carnitine O-palmitoyltransferase 1, brain isoform-like, partial [Onychostruthus taczanowskii]|uniref:carnitine O-palmitoyltransferase 1, brain isoform-like n=1 Tax=Onychostruthus taczanowskii TaxID=356909 RepID=UPI001B8089C5
DLLGPSPTRVPAARAANVAFAFLRFRSLVRGGSLPPVSPPKWGGVGDHLRHFGGGSHLAVLFGGRLFRVPLRAGGGRPLSPPELQGQFQKVLEQKGEGGPPPETPAVLTAGDRCPWARARALLVAGGGPSLAALGVLEDAPFVVAFDPSPNGDPPQNGDPPKNGEPPPEERDPPQDGDLDNEAKALLLGPPHNRWFDKSLTLVVFPSGRVGLSVEHSWGDPPVAGHLWEFALALDRSLGYDESGSCLGAEQGRTPEPPQELHWDLPPQVSGVLPQAREQFQAMAEGLQLHVVSVEAPPGPPGTPESSQELLPLALELALVRERGPALTYEPIPTRLFLEGRADGARGVGRPLLELERALRDPQIPRGRRQVLLEAALAQARGRRRAAMTGAGLERHLQALAAVANQMQLRPPFLTEVLGQPWALAFSPAPRPHPPLLPHPLRPAGGGFNPPHQDGYGVSFTGGGDAGPVLVHISCREGSPKTDPRRFSWWDPTGATGTARPPSSVT